MPIQVAGKLIPRNDNTWPVVDDAHIEGGYRVVADLLARNAIDVTTLKVGAAVHVVASQATYRVASIVEGVVTWEDFFPAASGDGEALASANAAAASASTATTKATEAAESASTATTQAVIATERATQALASQNAAADYAAVSSASAALANDWATKTSSEVVPGQGFGAKKYALDAEQSAINAETSFQSSVNAVQVLVDGFRTYRTVSTSLPSGVPRQGEEWIMVQ